MSRSRPSSAPPAIARPAGTVPEWSLGSRPSSSFEFAVSVTPEDGQNGARQHADRSLRKRRSTAAFGSDASVGSAEPYTPAAHEHRSSRGVCSRAARRLVRWGERQPGLRRGVGQRCFCGPIRVGPMTALLDAAGRRRSPATLPGYHAGGPPRNKGMRSPADPPTVDEIVAELRHARNDRHGLRLRAMIVVLWLRGAADLGSALARRAGPRLAARIDPRLAGEGRPPPRGRHGRAPRRRESCGCGLPANPNGARSRPSGRPGCVGGWWDGRRRARVGRVGARLIGGHRPGPRVERDEQEQLNPAGAIGEAADAVANARVHVAFGLTRRPKSLRDSRGANNRG